MTEPEQKIIIDEDWKAQVDREKAEAAAKKSATESPQPAAMKLPPASLTTLATTLMTQALASLGQIPSPVTGKPEVDLDMAKHMIDTIDVVFQKTEGNRTEEKTQLFDTLLHQLRMAFVATKSAPLSTNEV